MYNFIRFNIFYFKFCFYCLINYDYGYSFYFYAIFRLFAMVKRCVMCGIVDGFDDVSVHRYFIQHLFMYI